MELGAPAELWQKRREPRAGSEPGRPLRAAFASFSPEEVGVVVPGLTAVAASDVGMGGARRGARVREWRGWRLATGPLAAAQTVYATPLPARVEGAVELKSWVMRLVWERAVELAERMVPAARHRSGTVVPV